jgi:hypothetical protein
MRMYWRDDLQPGWRGNLHWREGVNDLLGRDRIMSLALAELLARVELSRCRGCARS